MMNILKQVVPMVEKLHLLTLYNVGLTDSSLETLGKLVQECANLRFVKILGLGRIFEAGLDHGWLHGNRHKFYRSDVLIALVTSS